MGVHKLTDLEAIRETVANIEITNKGEIRKREGYKTLRGFITWIKKTNKRYRKLGVRGDFTFRLPMKP